MTAATATAGTFDRGESRLLRILAGPAEGWLTLAGVALMVVALAWSIDDAQWIRGVGRLTDFLAPVGLAGVAVGFLGPKLGWGRWTTHLIGVAFAAMVIPIVGGGVVLGDDVTGWGPAALAARYRESADILTRVWVDLAIRNLPLTSEYGHYFIGFGALIWATGQHAAYAVFGHRRRTPRSLPACPAPNMNHPERPAPSHGAVHAPALPCWRAPRVHRAGHLVARRIGDSAA
jgi:hypothetical protein